MDSTPHLTEHIPASTPEVEIHTPPSAPAATPSKRKDKRPTLTLKGDEFGPEFRSLINKAAERAGMTQAAFVAETLTREAQRILKGAPLDTPVATPPALAAERLDEQDRRLAEIAAQVSVLSTLAEQVRALNEMQRRTLWKRVRDMLAPMVTPAVPAAAD